MKLKLPKWLQWGSSAKPDPSGLKLPAWASVAAEQSPKVALVIEANTDGYMREWLKLLGVKPRKADQYWLEVAYQCAKMDLQAAIDGTEFDPRLAKQAVEFRFSRAPEWALSNRQPGKGVGPATRGKEAREHYKRIRGALPF